MPTVSDLWGHALEVTPSYVAHRNRLIDVHLIHTFQTKGKRVLINTFKQNEAVPTMCIFFESKEKAVEAYEMMKDVYYPQERKPLVTQDSDIRSDVGYALMIACMVIPVILAMNAAFK
jgi:hypothetical protein